MIKAFDKKQNLLLNLILLSSLVIVSACGGGNKKNKTYDDGGKQRISVLTSSSDLRADPTLAGQAVALPRPYKNGQWAQAGGNAEHSVQHLALADKPEKLWKSHFGTGNQDYERMIAGPVSAAGLVFAMDAKGAVSALRLDNGQSVWKKKFEGKDRSKTGYGGGLALADGLVYVTSGYGYVVALKAETGDEVWRYETIVPFRGAPTVAAGRVFAVSQDNQIVVLDAMSGDYLWDQLGIPEAAGMLGAASPAHDGTAVIAAFSSGEIIAMLGSNGQILWQDTLASSRRLTPLASLADIDGSPVVDKGKVYAISHAGSLVAIDMRTGERSWEADVAGVNTPWIAGGFAYVVTVDGQVVCISLSDGRTRWVSQLQRFKNQEKRTGLIKWNGPVLAGDRLVVTSSHGYLLSLSPYTGDVLSGLNLGEPSSLPMMLVNETLVIQTDKGDLIAYR